MEYSGEYRISVYKYGKIKSRLLCNKTRTSQITFPNGMRNKVYFNGIDMFINYPLNKDKKIKITINHCFTDDDDDDLIMYNTTTDAMIQAEIENHFNNYEPHDF